MNLSSISLRAAEIWRIWAAHNIIEQCPENFKISAKNCGDEIKETGDLYRIIN